LAASRAPVARTSTTRNAAWACTAGSVCEETFASNKRTWRVACAEPANASNATAMKLTRNVRIGYNIARFFLTCRAGNPAQRILHS
jgi:hypothetical protein